MGPKVWGGEVEYLLPILNHQDRALLYANYSNYLLLQLKHHSYATSCKPEALRCESEIYDQRVSQSFLRLFSATVVENNLTR